METPPSETVGELRTPSIPIPPPRAGTVELENFIESATRAVLRAVASGLNPQPLPPHPETRPVDAAAPLNPQPLPPGDIIVGIIFRPRDIGARTPEVEV